MKLLYCGYCGDVFNIGYESKKCSCGRTSGLYLDNVNARYSGKHAVPLGFANNSFDNALKRQPNSGMGKEFSAFVIPVICDTFVKRI